MENFVYFEKSFLVKVENYTIYFEKFGEIRVTFAKNKSKSDSYTIIIKV